MNPPAETSTLSCCHERRPRLKTRLAARVAAAICLVACASSIAGCGYTIGSAFPSEIRSVHVPIFTSNSFRRGIEFQLTEAVKDEIKQRTHFRLANATDADTRLTGNIVEIEKDVLGETTFDDPRQLQIRVAIEVTWEDLRNGRVLAQQRFPIEPEIVQLVSEAEFAPEVGQSLATGVQQATDRMARQIVNLMEAPW